jgi:hypothetical protein
MSRKIAVLSAKIIPHNPPVQTTVFPGRELHLLGRSHSYRIDNVNPAFIHVRPPSLESLFYTRALKADLITPKSTLFSQLIKEPLFNQFIPQRFVHHSKIAHMWQRILKVLAIGILHGHDSIILGAWGAALSAMTRTR